MNTKRRDRKGPGRGRVGALLGAALIAAAGFSSGAPAQQLTTLYTFTGDNGANPGSSLIADPAGNLYGTTTQGTNNYGLVFEITP